MEIWLLYADKKTLYINKIEILGVEAFLLFCFRWNACVYMVRKIAEHVHSGKLIISCKHNFIYNKQIKVKGQIYIN